MPKGNIRETTRPSSPIKADEGRNRIKVSPY